MKSKYFLIKTLNNEIELAKTSDEMSEEEFMGIFLDLVKEAHSLTQEEYFTLTGDN